jgi:ABC-type antimicrobial peptide transport system permease subunit
LAARGGVATFTPLHLSVRPRLADARTAASVASVLRGLSPALFVSVDPFHLRLDRALLRERLLADLSTGVALLGGLLALVGAYGVTAHDASARQREAAIRVALGASSRSLYAIALRRIGLALVLGLVAGEVLGHVLARTAHAWLETPPPASPGTYALSGAALAVATLVATALAARKALHTQPSRLLASAD